MIIVTLNRSLIRTKNILKTRPTACFANLPNITETSIKLVASLIFMAGCDMTLTVFACFNELQLKSFCVIREQETRVNLLLNF